MAVTQLRVPDKTNEITNFAALLTPYDLTGVTVTADALHTQREPVIRYTGLGALALLAEIPQDASRDNADVAAIARIAGNPEDMEVLDAYCATGSLRRAADLLRLHHSSVARRLEPIAKTLGIELTEPTGLMRARLALTAWRLIND
ncbi:helix-turn-helix domain-containing protein [Streptomyces atratus]|uniref:helix-turn-helix domain-containing protein n=1 Tax=Streptomyces atratus TaxID=1893 RepID=UPI0033FA64F6